MKPFDTSNPLFVYGPIKAEDLVRLSGTPWIVASHLNLDLSSGMPPTLYGFGPLRAIRMDTHEVRLLYPTSDSAVDWDRTTFPDCPQPPDSLSSHGLNVRPLGGNKFRLYVCNHGGRHSVEIIDVAVHGEQLHTTWRGGVPVAVNDLGVWPNGVAPLPEEGFILSGYNVAKWRPGRGWEKFDSYQGLKPGAPTVRGAGGMSNGVEVSRDGQWIFIADSLRETVIRVPIGGGEQTVFDFNSHPGFHPDNLRWGEDGLLYVCGPILPKFQRDEDFIKCFDHSFMVTGILVMSIDPKTLAVREVVNSADGFELRYGLTSTALQVGDQLWLGTEIGDRVAVLSRRSEERDAPA